MKTLVRLPNWIGDAVMATPALSLLAESISNEAGNLQIWGPPKTAVLFERDPRFSRVHSIDEKQDPERLAQLRSEEFDRAILFTNSYSSARCLRDLGIPHRIGYRTQWRGGLLTQPVACGPRIRNLQMVDYYLHLVQKVVGREIPSRQPSLRVDQEEIDLVNGFLFSATDRSSFPLVGLAPGAAFGPSKQWFPERFAELASRLVGSELSVCLLGGPQEGELGERILRGLDPDRVRNLAGKTTLREMMALIACCDCLVTNDSGPMHIADALETPVVAFFGSTDSSWTGPQADHHRILQATVACNPCFLRECPLDYQCMASLTVDRAEQEVHCTLRKETGPTDSPQLRDSARTGASLETGTDDRPVP